MGCSQDMLITNGNMHNFYLEGSNQSLQMVFYYAVLQTLINFGSYLNCSHNINPNQIITQIDPLLELDCIPNSFCRMNYCQFCKQYYFYKEIENNTMIFTEPTLQENESHTNIPNKPVNYERKDCLNVISEDITVPATSQPVSHEQEIKSDVTTEDVNKAESFEFKGKNDIQNDKKPTALLLSHADVVKLSRKTDKDIGLNSKDTTLPKKILRNKADKKKIFKQNNEERKNKRVEADKKTRYERKKLTIKDKTNIPTQNHHLNENMTKKKRLTKEEPRCTSSIVHPGDNYEESFLTNKFTSLAEDLSKEERSKDTDEETGYCTAVETLSNISELEISSEMNSNSKKFTKKRIRKNKRKKGKNEAEEEFFSAESDIKEMELQYFRSNILKTKTEGFISSQVDYIPYKFKSTRTEYYDCDIQYLKAIVFTRYEELFTKHERYFYQFSQITHEKSTAKDLNELNKYKEYEKQKYLQLLEDDCKSHIFFYKDDGVYAKYDFMLLNEYLKESTDQTEAVNTVTNYENKFIRRYELTKDRFIVFLFYFFQRLKMKNLTEVFLREIIDFFFLFKDNRRMLNSSKKFIYIIFCNTVMQVIIEKDETTDTALRGHGGGPIGFYTFIEIMKRLPEYIRIKKLDILDYDSFYHFFDINLQITNFDKEDLNDFLAREDEIDRNLTLEGRNRSDYFGLA